jgi:hypothetical protein
VVSKIKKLIMNDLPKHEEAEKLDKLMTQASEILLLADSLF